MESTRQKKFSRLIQKELSEMFQRDLKSLTGNNTLVTVTIVRTTPDLGLAKVYLSFLPSKGKTLLLDTIQDNTKQIRQLLANRIRHQVRVIPDLQFYLDDTEEEASRINSLLDSLNIPPASDEKSDERKKEEGREEM